MIGLDKVQILALAAVEFPDWEGQYREICRWYSREFSTPLHVVEKELDQFQVLRHYYEDSFKKLKDSTDENQAIRYQEIVDSITYGTEKKEEEQAEDDEWERQMLEEIKADHEKLKKQQEIQESKAESTDSIDALNNPNIEDELLFNVQGEDGPPDF